MLCSKCTNTGSFACISCVIPNIIKEIPKIESEPVRNWIPCNERLPESNTQVLCYCRIGDFRIMEYDEQENRWYEGIHDYRLQAVTHWMPLSEPPEVTQE